MWDVTFIIQHLTTNKNIYELLDVNIKITDRNGVTHEVAAPTDMAINLMEVVKLYEFAEEGTIGVCGGMAMCASCQCYVNSDTPLPKNLMKKMPCFLKHIT